MLTSESWKKRWLLRFPWVNVHLKLTGSR